MFEEYAGHSIAVYGGYINNSKELLQCASGGIATALAKSMISQGGNVAGVSYTKDFKSVEYIIIKDIKDIDLLKGSKYVEADKNNIYKDAKKLLDEGEKLLFFGLPCIIGALKSFLGKEYKNLVTCELICHGPVSAKVHTQYVEWLESKYNSRITKFSVRHKKDKWMPSYLYAEFENGSVFQKEFFSTEYGYAFKLMGRTSCYNCHFKGNNRVGDIMIGDFWGATKKDPFWNEKGTSVIFVHTEKGKSFLNNTSDLKLYETTFEKAVKNNHMVIESKKLNPKRKKFEKLFLERGLFYAAKECSYRRYKVLRSIGKYTPKFVKPLGKKVYNRLKKIVNI